MKRVLFVGSKRIGLRVLQYMTKAAPANLAGAVTFDDSTDTRTELPGFRTFCESSHVKLDVINKPSALEGLVKAQMPDVVIVVGWYWVLGPSVLALAKDGWFGVHASLLPRYRGGSPLVWALINGDMETGVTLFQFDAGMDTGDMVAQVRFPIQSVDTIANLLAKSEDSALKVLEDVYPLLLQGKAPRIKQDSTQATYAALRRPEDGRIDWSKNAVTLFNFIRAQSQPYPGAWTQSEKNQTLRIWKATPFPRPFHGIPGRIHLIEGNTAIVGCGEATALILQRLQWDGSEEQDASTLLRFGDTLV